MTISTLADWQTTYADHADTPRSALHALRETLSSDDPAWIHIVSASELDAQLDALDARIQSLGGERAPLPLYGVPFAVKDNIDVAGLPTTAACPAFAYTPERSAAAVEKLLAAGAIVLGKTNLDQFATGLVGTRSPYGAVPNTFDPSYISGGSSSGSASVVARGLVAFSLGTDTAGSGRVPAGFNNLVGVKASCGAISTRGVVPACRSLDCVSIFALDITDADVVRGVLTGFDTEDAYSRAVPYSAPAAASSAATPRLGVPSQPEFFDDDNARAAFEAAVAHWQAAGAEIVELDFTPFHEAAALLYQGPWVAERYAAVGEFIESHADAADPVVADIITGGKNASAVEAFRAQYALAALKHQADALIETVDALLVPTAPSIYRQDEIAAEPVALNSRLGTYTNFVNLLDYCALALPGGFRDDGLPAGITLIAPAWHDDRLAALGARWQNHQPWPLGTGKRLAAQVAIKPDASPADDMIRVAVVGAHLRGMPLNWQLTERDARFVEQTETTPEYRLLALAGTTPPKPGLIRGADGAAIQVELWDVPASAFGSFVALIPAPLGIGTLMLADGREVKGFICEGWAADTARDVTAFGGWRAYIADQQAKAND
ncbi:allophanate hydrolase [Salinisphaera sp.]|uniref:allophanate hydrolase n=1 Tax=Salinisphaera sp. TaxID=1914330 RepID=UPI000C39E18E|nr:allophanate hydrolase [Salinisphaera sp.]MBS64380.1 allophanate hydrolase [Salinisphaera sp.]